MFWTVLNILLGIAESFVIWICIFRFMEVNGRTVYRKKAWDILGIFAASAVQFAMVLLFPNSFAGVGELFVMTIAAGLLLFHRNAVSVLLDVLLAVEIFLAQECGVFIYNSMLPVITRESVVPVANLCIVTKLVFMILLTRLMIKWRKGKGNVNLSAGQALSLLALPVFSLFFLTSLMEMNLVYVQLKGVWLVLANCIALLLLNLYFIYLMNYLFRTNKLEEEMKAFQMHNELQYRYYEELERKYRESRKVFHDMKNHLQAVSRLYEQKDEEAAEGYTRDLYHMLNVLGEQYYSSNHMLNIILNEKFSRARRAGIQVTAKVGDAEFQDMKDIDITTVFANLLDNAIEATSAAGEGAFLDFKIDTVQDFRVVRIRNSRGGKVSVSKRPDGRAPDCGKSAGTAAEGEETDRTPREERNPPKHMGLGLANVRCTLEKYHGSLEKSMTKDEYRVSVMIPGGEEAGG